ncbi:ABC transporter permease [Ensifer sp. NM-2]|uniref:ABC transporter permease n=1 Tax=Ensifer sp. NM-2 TaxID=2109730 RepID=UPI001FE0DC17|nr:ABC transporter permease [Ensifer sp. NM-2]
MNVAQQGVTMTSTRVIGPIVNLSRHSGLMIAAGFLTLLLVAVNLLSASAFGYFDLLYLSSGGLALAIAAVGATVVILTGGFDLSAGAIISLVNVIVATQLSDDPANHLVMSLLGVLVGALVGMFNGFFVAFLKLQSIVVTLSTMFIAGGITLLILDKPGGYVPASFSNFFVGSAIENVLPSAVVVLAVVALLWIGIKNSRFGVSIYAIGSDQESAAAAGINVRAVKLAAYGLAGAFYGLAGVVITAQTATADPLVGEPLLLQIFTAVVLGGTLLGGGRGGSIGSLVGAYSLMLIVNILLVLNVSAYYSTIVEGCVLVAAALAGAWRTQSIRNWLSQLSARLTWRPGSNGSQGLVKLIEPLKATLPKASWAMRHRDALRHVLPAYACFAVVVLLTSILIKPIDFSYVNSLLVLSSFLIILALGQGTVILGGGLDLSIPWAIGLCGILIGGWLHGDDGALWWAVPLTLLVGAMIGFANGIGVVVFQLPAIVVTLAMNGVLQGIAMLYSNGTPDGFASPGLRWLMTGRLIGFTPVVWLVAVFALFGIILLSRTALGRRIYAIGNSPRVARLSGVNVGRVMVSVYMLSGFCSALVGILLTGFGGQASLGMGNVYLLPSIAVVIIGGTLITGGRGYYIGMIGGVLLLTGLQTLLAGTTIPNSAREIIYGFVVLIAVVLLREKRAG